MAKLTYCSILLPALSSDHGDEACLTFKYHMYGFHIRELKAYLERSLGGLTNKWELARILGDQDNMWHHAQINFYMVSGGSSLMFRVCKRFSEIF